MANAKDLVKTPYPKILLVGDSGTHKTWFLGTVPGIYVFDHDKGMSVLRGRDVEYDTFKDAPRGSKLFDAKKGVYKWGSGYPEFLKKMNEVGEKIERADCPIKAIGIDSLTTLSQIVMNHVLDAGGHTGMPQIQHWGSQMELLKTIMDQLSAWPVTLVCTAHVQRDVNTVTQNTEMLPLLTGKLAGMIGIYFDEVWFAQPGSVAGGKYTLNTESTSTQRQAKTRYGVPKGTETDWAAVKKYFAEAPK